tara:strand:+ start:269 stop:559 length:291 start_codon:yes stop_codon:yes gene_type:complete
MNALILTHVVCMALSLILMSTAVVMALTGTRRAVSIASVGFGLTVLGSLSGFMLLLFSPLLSQCIILSGYLFAAALLYRVGFGWGVQSQARLLKKA